MARLPVGCKTFARYGLMDGLPGVLEVSILNGGSFKLDLTLACMFTIASVQKDWAQIKAAVKGLKRKAMKPSNLDLLLRRLARFGAPKETRMSIL